MLNPPAVADSAADGPGVQFSLAAQPHFESCLLHSRSFPPASVPALLGSGVWVRAARQRRQSQFPASANKFGPGEPTGAALLPCRLSLSPPLAAASARKESQHSQRNSGLSIAASNTTTPTAFISSSQTRERSTTGGCHCPDQLHQALHFSPHSSQSRNTSPGRRGVSPPVANPGAGSRRTGSRRPVDPPPPTHRSPETAARPDGSAGAPSASDDTGRAATPASPSGTVVRPKDRRPRPKRWADAVDQLPHPAGANTRPGATRLPRVPGRHRVSRAEDLVVASRLNLRTRAWD